MVTLSAFADEISPELDEQIAVLREEGIRHLELRSVWTTNVLDLTDAQLQIISAALDKAEIAVSAIGSPIGKVPIDAPFDIHVHRFERAVTVARYLGAPFIRIFSFYPPANSRPDVNMDMALHRDDVLLRLRELTARARAADIVLLHENDKDIYGDTIARCVDLCESIADQHFGAVFDPANFIQCGQRPFPDGFGALEPWLRYIHVKDALADGTVVPVGSGAGEWPSMLQRLQGGGYEGVLSLEPHLAESGRFSGFSGPDRFHEAAGALKSLLRTLSWNFD